MPERGSLDALLWKTLLIIGVLWLLYHSMSFVVITLIALIIAAAILPVADAAQKYRIPRSVTVLGIYLIGLGVLTLLVALLIPAVTMQAQNLAARLPAYRQTVSGWIETARNFTGRWGPERIELPDIGVEQVGPVIQQLAQRSLAATRGIFSGAIAAFLILFVAGYFVVDGHRIASGLLSLVPPAHRRETARIGAIVLKRMGGYLRAQVAISVCITAVLSAGLAILKIETPILIGVIAGVLNFVPYLGSTVALILAVLVALNHSTFAVIGVVVLFGVEQFLEGNVLVPYLQGRMVQLHPLAVLAALIVGAGLAGLVGAVVAVPILAGLNAVVQEVYVKRFARAEEPTPAASRRA
jgi:predicted PurR-regulated permease PerM